MKPTQTLGDMMAAYDAERLAEIERDEARRNTPEERARLEAKRKEEFDRGVRLGWWSADGEPIDQPDESEDEDAEDE